MAGRSDRLSDNEVDRLLGHRSGPDLPVSVTDLRRLQHSAGIVHGNFTLIARLTRHVHTGVIAVEESPPFDSYGGSEKTETREYVESTVSTEVYRLVHNYLASVYSFNEQVRELLTNHCTEEVDKSDFLTTSTASNYVRWIAFPWGLRNDLQHGNYACLDVVPIGADGTVDLYHLTFDKTAFEPTPTGDLDDAGDYLHHFDDERFDYPLAYLGEFHTDQFNRFERDLNEWCRRDLQA